MSIASSPEGASPPRVRTRKCIASTHDLPRSQRSQRSNSDCKFNRLPFSRASFPVTSVHSRPFAGLVRAIEKHQKPANRKPAVTPLSTLICVGLFVPICMSLRAVSSRNLCCLPAEFPKSEQITQRQLTSGDDTHNSNTHSNRAEILTHSSEEDADTKQQHMPHCDALTRRLL